MLEKLRAKNFDILFLSHAEAILGVDFPSATSDLEQVLSSFSVPITELIAGGGGEGKGTQRLRHALADKGWSKTKFTIEKSINGVRRESQSHEVDHVLTTTNGFRVALEIEWNNKDPFFDRDLENFKRLHADGAISVGVIVTRGRSLHEGLRLAVARFLRDRSIESIDDLRPHGYNPTTRQREEIARRTQRGRDPKPFAEACTDVFVADKFGEATTHWAKLEDRVKRGVGNPCPLLLIGLPISIVRFGVE